MAGKVQAKRDALRSKLIKIAYNKIASDGSSAIKARELAAEAGCSVGAIYNLFSDLHSLIMVVNLQTFQELGDFVVGKVAQSTADEPVEQLIVMGHAYLDFASDNIGIWRTLFDVQGAGADAIPDWYWDEIAKVLALIELPLRQTISEKSDDEIKVMTRILFSSVHGIVLLGLKGSIFETPREALELMIEVVVRRFVENN